MFHIFYAVSQSFSLRKIDTLIIYGLILLLFMPLTFKLVGNNGNHDTIKINFEGNLNIAKSALAVFDIDGLRS